MSELRRIQLAHEGMRMLLCSELKQAEDLFKASRSATVGKLSCILWGCMLWGDLLTYESFSLFPSSQPPLLAVGVKNFYCKKILSLGALRVL